MPGCPLRRTGTKPLDGARKIKINSQIKSQSEAAYEPTGFQANAFPCRSWLASEGGLTLDQSLPPVLDPGNICRKNTRLHCLAPLPTPTPESAGLCALYLVFIVFGSLPISDWI
jgi:hypothetical protein